MAKRSRESNLLRHTGQLRSSSRQLWVGEIGESATSNAHLSRSPTPSSSLHHLHHAILTRATQATRETAVSLLDWVTKEENQSAVKKILKSIQERFDKSFRYLNPSSINRERLWRSFYLLCSSEEFIKFWSDFLTAAGIQQTPMLYQHLTTLLFNERISQAVKTESRSSYDAGPLTENEANALRYTAGYICCHLREKLEQGNHELKEELILCLMELSTHRDASSASTGNTHEEWTIRVDRGGLWYVKNTTCLLFVAIEEEVRKSVKTLLTGSGHRLTLSRL